MLSTVLAESSACFTYLCLGKRKCIIYPARLFIPIHVTHGEWGIKIKANYAA